jgi:hypothetical protein
MVTRALEILYFSLQIFSIASLSVLTYTFLFGLKQPGVSRPNPLLAGYYYYSPTSLSGVGALILFPITANTSSYVLSGIVSCLL